MKVRAALIEALVRLSLLVVAGALLRWATVTQRDWLEDFNATLERTWGGWFASLALVAAAGFLVGLAALAGRPRGYRILIPLVIALPPLILLGHYYLVIENAVSNGDDLPWILGRFFFYMEPAAQYVLALVVGFGVASGFQPRVPRGGSVVEPAGFS